MWSHLGDCTTLNQAVFTRIETGEFLLSIKQIIWFTTKQYLSYQLLTSLMDSSFFKLLYFRNSLLIAALIPGEKSDT